MPAIGVEQRAVGGRIDKGALVVLAVDFDQRRAERAEHLNADRLIVDEGPRAAVGELHAAQDQFVIAVEIVVGEDAARRMIRRKLERGGDLTVLGAVARQRRVAARAKRERKSVEQDRFAGAGLARKRGKPGAEIDVQPVDQNDVANGKTRQHGMTDSRKRMTDFIRYSAFCRQPFAGSFAGLQPVTF